MTQQKKGNLYKHEKIFYLKCSRLRCAQNCFRNKKQIIVTNVRKWVQAVCELRYWVWVPAGYKAQDEWVRRLPPHPASSPSVCQTLSLFIVGKVTATFLLSFFLTNTFVFLFLSSANYRPPRSRHMEVNTSVTWLSSLYFCQKQWELSGYTQEST